jgi:peptide/nickel transport system substrate-binding protein
MWRTFLLSIALVSFAFSASADRRPRYGGTLRVEMRAPLESVEALEPGLVFETLVRFDEKGSIQPVLATAWTHDVEKRRWVFTPRPNVVLHNGAAWQPGLLSAPDDQPIEEILRGFARPRSAIIVKAADGQLIGTGPFKVAKWEAGKSATLAAHDAYWGGRPYLDAIEYQMGRPLRDQALDLEVGKADVVEVSPADVRRLRQRGAVVATAPARETLALVCDQPQEALALSIDRAAINDVILQRQGESTGALVPQWLSGYAFLFAPVRDIARARPLAAPAPVGFAYDRDDPLIRAVAERIVVNAAEAGVTLRAGGPAQVKLVRLPIASTDLQTTLSDLAATLNPQAVGAGLLEVEQALLAGSRVIPLFHLPLAHQLSPRVKGWPNLSQSNLAEVWMLP